MGKLQYSISVLFISTFIASCGQSTETVGAALPALAISGATVSEGNVGDSNKIIFNVELSKPAVNAVRFDYQTVLGSGDGYADSADFTEITQTSGRIAVGSQREVIEVDISGDDDPELNETFTLRLININNATVAGGGNFIDTVGTIKNDDAIVIDAIAISVSVVDSVEGNDGDSNKIVFIVELSKPAVNAVSFDYQTVLGSGGGYADSTDFTEITQTSGRIAVGLQREVIEVDISGDDDPELNETFTLSLTDISNANVLGGGNSIDTVGTIENDDAIAISVGVVDSAEGNVGDSNKIVFTVELSNPAVEVVSFDYQTVLGSGGGSANSADSADFTELTQTSAEIAVGSQSKVIEVDIIGDDDPELNETFTLSLTDIYNATVAGGGNSIDTVGTIENDDAIVIDAPAISVGVADSEEGNDGDSNKIVFTVRLSKPAVEVVSFDYQTVLGSGGGYADSTDFTELTQTSGEIAVGSQSKVIEVDIIGDDDPELSETFTLRLTDISNATVAGGGNSIDTVGTIENDDSPAISVSVVASVEGNDGDSNKIVFTVRLSEPAVEAVSFDYKTVLSSGNGSANSADFTELTLTSEEIAVGSQSKVIEVDIIGDDDPELNEIFTLSLTNINNAILTGGGNSINTVGTIENDDFVFATVGVVNSVEGSATDSNKIVFTVRLSEPAVEAVSFDYQTVLGSGGGYADSADFTEITQTSAEIAVGSQSKVIEVDIIGDDDPELNETFTLRLTNINNATVAGGGDSIDTVGTIENDDAIAISVGVVDSAEGNVGDSNKIVFTVELSNPAVEVVSFDYQTVLGSGGGSADSADSADFTELTTASAEIAVGSQRVVIEVAIIGDTEVENDETFTLRLTNINNAIATGGRNSIDTLGTIENDDASAISVGVVDSVEGNAGDSNKIVFTVRLSKPAIEVVSFNYQTVLGSADSTDFTELPQTAEEIAVGTLIKVIEVDIIGDDEVENDETFTLSLTDISNANVAGGGNSIDTVGTIENDDASVISVSVVDSVEGNVGDSNKIAFTVELSKPAVEAVSFDYQTVLESGGGSADGADGADSADFVALPLTSAEIAVGSQSKVIEVTISGDAKVENDETFTLSLTGISNANVLGGGDSIDTVGTIENDDFIVATVSVVDSVEGDVGGSNKIAFTVNLSEPAIEVVSFNYQTVLGAGNGFADGADFSEITETEGEIAIDEQIKVIEVDISGDVEPELSETFTLRLTSINNAIFVGGVDFVDTVGTIKNDDAIVIDVSVANSVEGNDGESNKIVFTVELSKPAIEVVSFDYQTVLDSGDRAADSTDFTELTTASAEIAVGKERIEIEVTIIGDTEVETDETFTLSLTNIENVIVVGGGDFIDTVGTIKNDDFIVATVSVANSLEGDVGGSNKIVFTVKLSEPAIEVVSFDYQTVFGSGDRAADSTDFTELSIASGEIAIDEQSKVIEVDIIGDVEPELSETFTLRLTSINNAIFVGGGDFVDTEGTIENDDASAIGVSVANSVEGNDGDSNKIVFTVELSNPAVEVVSFYYRTVFGSGDRFADSTDFTTLNIASGEIAIDEQSKLIEVYIIGDDEIENDETFILRLTNINNANVSGGGNSLDAVGTIKNDDFIIISVGEANSVEGSVGDSKKIVFTVELSKPAVEVVRFNYQTVMGSADSTDFTTLSIASGEIAVGSQSEEIEVDISGDDKVEPNETFTLRLTNINNATVADGENFIDAVGTIENDDLVGIEVSVVDSVEGDVGGSNKIVFTVELSEPAVEEVGFEYQTVLGSGSGFADSADSTDFTEIGMTSTVITVGSQSKVIEVAIIGDVEIENDETFTLSLTDISSANVAGGENFIYTVGTIQNDDIVVVNEDGDRFNDDDDVDDDGNGLIEISTIEELINIGNNLEGTSYNDGSSGKGNDNGCGDGDTIDTCKGYELKNDITLIDDWVPAVGIFSGIFDGGGYTISNLNITNDGRGVGFFIQVSGIVKNVVFEGGSVTGIFSSGAIMKPNLVGVVTGRLEASGMLDNVSTNVSVNGNAGAYNYVAGLVGDNFGIIQNSSAAGTVNGGSGDYAFAGGLAGRNKKTIRNSYATSDVNGGAGRNGRVGGLVGKSQGIIENCYSKGDVNGDAGNSDWVGGIAGELTTGGSVVNSYAIGSVRGGAGNSDMVGRIAGINGVDNLINDSYYLNEDTIYDAELIFTFAGDGKNAKEKEDGETPVTGNDVAGLKALTAGDTNWDLINWSFTDDKYPSLKTYVESSVDIGVQVEGGLLCGQPSDWEQCVQ